ncbi:MAG: hypothetical protein ABFR97_03955 [Thermodesulfobacteriota bacterium]
MARDKEDLKKFDDREWYCPMLGHTIGFSYCRTMQDGLPCGRIRNCWFELLPIQDFVQANYSEDERNAIFKPPKSRAENLMATLERVTGDPDEKEKS